MLIEQVIASGARSRKACVAMGIGIRTWQCCLEDGEVHTDQRALAECPDPTFKLSAGERSEALAVCYQSEFVSLPPHQLMARLGDKGRYLVSEASFYRILRNAQEVAHRGRGQLRCVHGWQLNFWRRAWANDRPGSGGRV